MAKDVLIRGERSGHKLIKGKHRFAHGTFGSVFKGREVTDDSYRYAIKFPNPINNKQSRDTLMREAEIHAGFSHPHITPVVLYDVFVYRNERGQTRHTPAIVTPLADLTLERISETNKDLPLEAAISIGDDIAEAYNAVHQAGLVYVDSGPSSVLLRRNSGNLLVAELTDFGGAKRPQHEKQNETLVVGKTLYSAPETFSGICTHASDQYGWAAGVAYPAITGEAPWNIFDYPYDEVFGEYNYMPPRSFENIIGAQRMTRLHDAIGEVTERALKEASTDRYQSMAALLDDLRKRRAKALEEQNRARRIIL